MERSQKAKATFEKIEAMDVKKLNVKKTKYIYTFKCYIIYYTTVFR